MIKALKVVHIVLLLVLTLYATEIVLGYGIKAFYPSNDFLKYWQPGREVVVSALALCCLIGLLGCSVGVIKRPSRSLLWALLAVWLACFTWFGWLSPEAPFRIQELLGVDPSDAAAIQRAEALHFLESLAAYLVISVMSVYPLILPALGIKPPGSRFA